MSFLTKHYKLRSTIPQVNNYVVFEGFFTNSMCLFISCYNNSCMCRLVSITAAVCLLVAITTTICLLVSITAAVCLLVAITTTVWDSCTIYNTSCISVIVKFFFQLAVSSLMLLLKFHHFGKIILVGRHVQCSPLNSNSRGPTKFVLIMICSNYEFTLNIKCKYNGTIITCMI